MRVRSAQDQALRRGSDLATVNEIRAELFATLLPVRGQLALMAAAQHGGPVVAVLAYLRCAFGMLLEDNQNPPCSSWSLRPRQPTVLPMTRWRVCSTPMPTIDVDQFRATASAYTGWKTSAADDHSRGAAAVGNVIESKMVQKIATLTAM